MLCHEFEDQLTDYLDGTLAADSHRAFAEHAMRCPVCHDLLGDVKSTLLACSSSEAPPAGVDLDARILMKTAPETTITCEQFEEHLTDYLDGFPDCAALSPLGAPRGAVRQLQRTSGRSRAHHRSLLHVSAGRVAGACRSRSPHFAGHYRQRFAGTSSRTAYFSFGGMAARRLGSNRFAATCNRGHDVTGGSFRAHEYRIDGRLGGWPLSREPAVSGTDRGQCDAGIGKGSKKLAGSVDELMSGEDKKKGSNENENQNKANQNSAPQGSQNNDSRGQSKSENR